MWSLLKKEWTYNSFTLVILLLVSSVTLPLITSLTEEQFTFDAPLTHLLVMVMLFFMMHNRFLEKRSRLIRLLPLSARRQAVARLLFQAPLCLGVLAIYAVDLCIYLPPEKAEWAIYRWLTLGSLAIAANAVLAITFDLWPDQGREHHRGKALLTVAFWLFLLAAALLYREDEFLNGHSGIVSYFYFTSIGVLLQYGIALILSLVSIDSYCKRTGYYS
ncbi:hypothetical protein JXO59_09495 [candidate division KSB1 bacterium]|nr:hypothetical protein [candidate division KSB1 bacterium]